MRNRFSQIRKNEAEFHLEALYMPQPFQLRKLAVQIVRFVNEHQPGWVECEFQDAEGRRHEIIDKIPVLTCDDIWKDSSYPQPGIVCCEVLDRWKDATGRELARISTDRLGGVESTEGLTEFVVMYEQLSQ